MESFQFTGNNLFNYTSDSNMNAVGDSGGDLPDKKK